MDRDEDRLTLSRRRGARMDVCSEARFPDVSRGRLATQIRQDLWRELQVLRGFSPVIEILRSEGGLTVRAGGQLESVAPKAEIERKIADLLADTEKRERWVRFAAHKRVA